MILSQHQQHTGPPAEPIDLTASDYEPMMEEGAEEVISWWVKKGGFQTWEYPEMDGL